MPAFSLGRPRRRSTKRSASTRPRSQEWATCSTCAPRVPCPQALSRPLPVYAACVAATQRPHASRAVPLPASHARLLTRQRASAFNQALSFDTSKVTDMDSMFTVRFARALTPTPALRWTGPARRFRHTAALHRASPGPHCPSSRPVPSARQGAHSLSAAKKPVSYTHLTLPTQSACTGRARLKAGGARARAERT